MPKSKFLSGILKTLKWFAIILLILVLLVVAFMYLAPTFGARASGDSLQRIEQSENYRDGRFVNKVDTEVDTREPGAPLDLATYLFPAAGKNPSATLPSLAFNNAKFNAGDFVWLGHSTLMFKTVSSTVLIDPVFNRASPIPIGGKPFVFEVTPTIDVLPAIDVVLISHDHYDHLDHITIGELSASVGHFVVPLGIGAHLMRWGVSADKIVELDWYESHDIADTTFTLTPSRHFSGRGFSDRFATLWGSWAIKAGDLSVFHSGDSGYFDEFKSIGEQFGPFDIAFVENGAYNKDWSQIHMMPEQSAQAAVDLGAKVFFPIHWGKFDLAKHQWTDPIVRAVAAGKRLNIKVAAPLVGQIFQADNPPFESWWE